MVITATLSVDGAIVSGHILGAKITPLSIKWIRDVQQNTTTFNTALDEVQGNFSVYLESQSSTWLCTFNATLEAVNGGFSALDVSSVAEFDYTLESPTGSFIASQSVIGVFDLTLDAVVPDFTDAVVDWVSVFDYTLSGVDGSFDAVADTNNRTLKIVSADSYSNDAIKLTCSLAAITTQSVLADMSCAGLTEDATSYVISMASDNSTPRLNELNLCSLVEDADQTSVLLESGVNGVSALHNLLNAFSNDAVSIQPLRFLSIQDLLIFITGRIESRLNDCASAVRHEIKRVYEQPFFHWFYPTIGVEFISDTDTRPFLIKRPVVNPYADFDVSLSRLVELRTTSGDFKTSAVVRKFCQSLRTAILPPLGKSQSSKLPPRPQPQPQPSNHVTYVIQTRNTYMITHTIQVKLVSDNTLINLDKLSLSYDNESYSWQFSGTLSDKSDISHFNLTNFEPVQLHITINGYVWLVIVEEIPETQTFGKTDIQLSGRSLSALLGEPWSQPTNYLQGYEMTVQQLADAMIPFDWTIDWQCPVWLLPANTYSHTGQTPLQSLKTIASNIGAVLHPMRDSKTIKIQPRYPVLPWNYNVAGIAPGIVIPDSAILSKGIKSRTSSPVNGVYIHGTTPDGVLGRCVLQGTAGDMLVQTESNCLITDVVAARSLGERVLAGKHTQSTIATITTFLGGYFPLLEVGMLAQIGNEKTTVSGVSINAEFGKVQQILTFGEQNSNMYAKFMNILPKNPLLIGTVVTTYGENSVLALVGGGVITARGTGIVGQNYFIRNGVIETQAPMFDGFDIVI